jgi:hypothetical protein
MKRIQINLTGHVTYGASRSFVIELADDFPVRTLDRDFLETLADHWMIGWDFQDTGFVHSTHYSVEEVDEQVDLPVIQIGGCDQTRQPCHG